MQAQKQPHTNTSIQITTYLIDKFKTGSPHHRNLINFSKMHSQYFQSILAIRINDHNPDIVEALSLEDVYSFQPASIVNFYDKILIVFNILQALHVLSQKHYFTGMTPLSSFLYSQKNSPNIKIKPYLAVPIEGFKFDEPKKDKETAKNGIQLCFDFKKYPSALDIWKWAVFTASFLFQFQFDKYLDAALGSEKPAQFITQISKKNDFGNSNQLMKCLSLCLSPDPQKRPKFPQIALIFEKILATSAPLNQQALQQSKQLYLKKEQLIKSQVEIEINQNLLLTEQLKKKLNGSFVKNGLKAPKSYKPLYRATRFDFSTRVFYEMCSDKGKLVFIIDTEQYGTICCYIEPTIKLCENNGLRGDYITDEHKHSFIYSTKNQQSYKLQNKDRAYRSVPGKGPIIGDGDLILSSNRNRNQCNFPQSFQTGKHKTLMKQSHFKIRNYDVYMANF